MTCHSMSMHRERLFLLAVALWGLEFALGSLFGCAQSSRQPPAAGAESELPSPLVAGEPEHWLLGSPHFIPRFAPGTSFDQFASTIARSVQLRAEAPDSEVSDEAALHYRMPYHVFTVCDSNERTDAVGAFVHPGVYYIFVFKERSLTAIMESPKPSFEIVTKADGRRYAEVTPIDCPTMIHIVLNSPGMDANEYEASVRRRLTTLDDSKRALEPMLLMSLFPKRSKASARESATSLSLREKYDGLRVECNLTRDELARLFGEPIAVEVECDSQTLTYGEEAETGIYPRPRLLGRFIDDRLVWLCTCDSRDDS